MFKEAVDRAPSYASGLDSVVWRDRWLEAVPGIVSWIVLTAPIWLTLIHPVGGIAFVSFFIALFLFKAGSWGIRALLTRRVVLKAAQVDWLGRLEQIPDWTTYRVIFLVRAYREGNVKMLANSLESIFDSRWPKPGGRLERVEVVYATEEGDEVTGPLVDRLSGYFAGRLAVRQIVHPREPGVLPGPSSAMHYVGRRLHEQAIRRGEDTRKILIVDLDADTVFHPSYLPCLMYQFLTDPNRQRRLYQPVVLFTTDYWNAPLHSRLSALGSSVQTLGWNHRPEVAFSGTAGSLYLYHSVDFWPTNSHSQDSGVELKLKLRFGREFDVVGVPLPVTVFPVMMVGPRETVPDYVKSYMRSGATLFRQSARWREGPLDEFVEAVRQGSAYFGALKLWRGIERDTLSIVPGYGLLVVPWIIRSLFPEVDSSQLGVLGSAAFTMASVLGLVVFLFTVSTPEFVRPRRWPRRLFEMFVFWLLFPIYIPVLSGIAGAKTSTAYLLGKRPNGHYLPTPK